MPNINKILSKVNKAKSAISSAKGIKSKLSQINYTSVINSNELESTGRNCKTDFRKKKSIITEVFECKQQSKEQGKEVSRRTVN